MPSLARVSHSLDGPAWLDQPLAEAITRLGPWRLAGLMLGLILVLNLPSFHPIAPADASQIPWPVQYNTVQSPDYVRYYGLRSITSASGQGSWQVQTNSCTNATSAVGSTFNNMMSAVDDDPATSDGAFADEGGTYWDWLTGDGNSCLGNLEQEMNLTFPSPLNLTQVVIQYGIRQLSDNQPCTQSNYLWLLNSTGIAGNITLSCTATCRDGFGACALPTANYLNGTFLNISSIVLVHNYANCWTQNCGSPHSTRIDVFELHAWDINNKTYPMELGYADYLAQRANKHTIAFSVAGGQNVTSQTVTFPPAASGFYYSDVFFHATCQAQSEPRICYQDLQPLNVPGLSFVESGVSENFSGKAVEVWSWTNSGNSAVSTVVQNASLPFGLTTNVDTYPAFSPNPAQPSVTYGQMAALTTCGNGGPVINNFHDCAPSVANVGVPFANATMTGFGSPDMFGFGYKANTGPFLTIPVLAIWSDATGTMADFNNIEYSSATPTQDFVLDPSPAGQVNLNIPPYYGNALYMMMWRTGSSAICNSANSTLTVNGAPTPLLFQTSEIDGSPSHAIQQGCAWLLDDFARANNLGFNAQGNLQYFDNLRNTGSYSIHIPDNLFNLGSFETLSQFHGNHSQRTNCNVQQGVNFCFGNLDTTGQVVANSKSTWNICIYDADSTPPQPLDPANPGDPAARIFESASSTVNLTSNIRATPQGAVSPCSLVNATLQGDPNPSWTVTANGFNSLQQNVVNVVTTQVNWTISMTRNASQPYSPISCNIVNAVTQCVTVTSPSAQGACSQVNLQTLNCNNFTNPLLTGGVTFVHYWLRCPVDANGQTFLVNSSWFDTASNRGFQLLGANICSNPDALRNGLIVNSTHQGLPDVANWTVSVPGYHSLQIFNPQNTFNPKFSYNLPLTVFQTYLQPGTGTSCASHATASIGSAQDPSDLTVKQEEIIYIVDDDTNFTACQQGSTTVTQKPGGAANGQIANNAVSFGIKGLGCSLGACDPGGKMLWGLFLFALFVVGTALAVGIKVGGFAGGMSASIVAFPAAGLNGYLGLWELWVIALVIVAAFGILLIGLKFAGGSTSGGTMGGGG